MKGTRFIKQNTPQRNCHQIPVKRSCPLWLTQCRGDSQREKINWGCNSHGLSGNIGQSKRHSQGNTQRHITGELCVPQREVEMGNLKCSWAFPCRSCLQRSCLCPKRHPINLLHPVITGGRTNHQVSLVEYKVSSAVAEIVQNLVNKFFEEQRLKNLYTKLQHLRPQRSSPLKVRLSTVPNLLNSLFMKNGREYSRKCGCRHHSSSPLSYREESKYTSRDATENELESKNSSYCWSGRGKRTSNCHYLASCSRSCEWLNVIEPGNA